MDATDARARLIRLQSERFEALELGIENPSPYISRLDAAIEEARDEYITGVVLEIAALRGELAGATRG